MTEMMRKVVGLAFPRGPLRGRLIETGTDVALLEELARQLDVLAEPEAAEAVRARAAHVRGNKGSKEAKGRS